MKDLREQTLIDEQSQQYGAVISYNKQVSGYHLWSEWCRYVELEDLTSEAFEALSQLQG
jgi:hypothetical protein